MVTERASAGVAAWQDVEQIKLLFIFLDGDVDGSNMEELCLFNASDSKFNDFQQGHVLEYRPGLTTLQAQQ